MNIKTGPVFLAIAVGLFTSAAVPIWAADAKLEETVVGPANAGGTYTVSKMEAHIAYVTAKGSRLAVVVDGVEGPVVDEMLGGAVMQGFTPGQVPMIVTANIGGRMIPGGPTPVLFSENGQHHAYIARQGNEYMVMHDGKEIGRGPRLALATSYNSLAISPGGKFVYWQEMKTDGGRGSWRLFVNGKVGPWAGHQDIAPVFSPDDSRYAYNAGSVEDYKKQILYIDGKVATYVGHTPVFTADSKVLLTIAPNNVVLVDGKPGPFTGISLESITPSTVGSHFAVIMRRKLINNEGVGVLYLDGKEVSGTEGAMSISFSPDGKHYALRCRNPEAKTFFMVLDGKKGNEYQNLAEAVYWTPDSSKAIYQVGNGGQNFVVVNMEEFAVQMVSSLMRPPIVTPKVGGRYAFTSGDGMNRNFLAIVDGKQVLPPGFSPNGDSFEFSPNGARYAFVVGPIGRNEISGLVVDGTLDNTLAVSGYNTMDATKRKNPYFVLSPDGKNIARMARMPDNSKPGLYVNNKLVYANPAPVGLLQFTPDSQHLYWIGSERFPDRGPPYYIVYADNQQLIKLDGASFQGTTGAYDMGADGVLTFIATVGNDVKRFRVTPAADMNIARMITQAEEAQAKALAAAAAAKEKADADKAAATAKAKADSDATAAKRKADADAVNAAKAKARTDAAAAKAAAKQKK